MKRAAKGHSLQIVTANSLVSGAVVFLTAEERWSSAVADAAVADSAEVAEAMLAIGNRAADDDVVVEPYLVDVLRDGGTLRPLLLRERIRALGGPTIQENRTLAQAAA